jgi:membrane protein YdbS with pleckstrin-like domain
MQFSNSELDISSLPKAEEANLIPIAEQYYTVITYYKTFYWFVLFIITLIIAIVNKEFHSWMMAGMTTAVFTILCFLNFRLAYLNFKNKAYAIREHDIIYQTGWLNKSLHVCPFNRIQHCSVDAGVFERDLGISKLKIYSAGGNDSDIVIPGLTHEQANNMRDLIILKNQQE